MTPATTADIQITKVVQTNPTPTVGQQVVFRVRAINAGPGNATGVVVQDLLPSGYQFVSKSVFTGAYNESTGVWTIGNHQNGSTAVLDVSAAALARGSYTNTATRTASSPNDPTPANNSASIAVTPQVGADIRISKTITSNPTPTIGEKVTFHRARRSNLGPGNATGRGGAGSVAEGLPVRVRRACYNGSYNEATGVWSVGNIGNGATADARHHGDGVGDGQLPNTATKTASTPTDPVAGNDSASVSGDAAGAADIADQQ